MMKTKKNLPLSIVSFIFCVFIMIMIFLLSYQSGEESAARSTGFYELFLRLTGFDFISHNMFRKFAHFTEYCALGFCFTSGFTFSGIRSAGIAGGYFSFVYSVSDEIHQFFVPERACRIYDVYIDFGGILFGIILFGILIAVINRIFSKS